MKKKKNLKKLLNLGVLDYTNITPKYGKMDMPFVKCPNITEIDYIATYSQPSTYHLTKNTCVSFFEYDVFFDGLYGLWNAIYYGVKELMDFYIDRFKNVKYFIAPDYSKCGDVSEIENNYRQFKSRVVSVWLTLNSNALVIPLISCANDVGMEYMLDGMEESETVAFNLKGPMENSEQLEIFVRSIRKTVDRLKRLKTIVVYSTSPNKEKILEIFKYAVKEEINIIIPDNMLQTRNRLKRGVKNGICS